MRMSRNVLSAIILLTAVAGCPSKPLPQPLPSLSLPDLTLAQGLPQFANQVNEVQIADSFNDVDPSFVLGSLVDVKSGEVRALNNYLKREAKPKMTPQSEIAFKNFVENSVAASAAWLDFVKGQVNDKVRAEVTVTKTAKVTVNSAAIDRDAILKDLGTFAKDKQAHYGIIIGYIDYVLSASFFRDSGAEGAASGYGAKIGGNWYSKYENSAAHHRIVAVWSPLPYLLDMPKSPQVIDLTKATLEAINTGRIQVRRIASIARIENTEHEL